MLKFWELAPSPNNVKVRMALRFKGIEFESVAVDPGERDELVSVSGQEQTPVVADRGIVLNDSEAILQYLDANYPGAPRLFPAAGAARRECDDWKRTLDERVAAHWVAPFRFTIRRADELDLAARDRFHEGLSWLEAQLGDAESFKGREMAICDLRVAEWTVYALPGPGLIERVGLFRKFRENFAVSAGNFPQLERFLVKWNGFLA